MSDITDHLSAEDIACAERIKALLEQAETLAQQTRELIAKVERAEAEREGEEP